MRETERQEEVDLATARAKEEVTKRLRRRRRQSGHDRKESKRLRRMSQVALLFITPPETPGSGR